MTSREIEIENRLAEIRRQQAWGREHPFAGVCGEDDAVEDERVALTEELHRLQFSRETAATQNLVADMERDGLL